MMHVTARTRDKLLFDGRGGSLPDAAERPPIVALLAQGIVLVSPQASGVSLHRPTAFAAEMSYAAPIEVSVSDDGQVIFAYEPVTGFVIQPVGAQERAGVIAALAGALASLTSPAADNQSAEKVRPRSKAAA